MEVITRLHRRRSFSRLVLEMDTAGMIEKPQRVS